MNKIILIILLCLLCISCKSVQKGQSQKQEAISSISNEDLEPSEVLEYKATALSTNFTVPLLRYNPLVRNSSGENKMGNISFFNSIGAGIGVFTGTLRIVTNKDKDIIDRELVNTFGVQLGVLFSASNSSNTTQNVFAPTIAVSVLNFQFGYGYELGTKGKDEHNGFVTIAYGIPISKLVRGGFYVFRRTPKPIKKNATGFLGN